MTNQHFDAPIVALATSPNEGSEGQRNKKTRILSALLSASALGVFLEGCGGGSPSGGGSSDTGGDTSSDTGIDTSGDTSIDTSGDTGIDTSGDTGIDTSGDTGIDTSGDTGGDAGSDTGGDAGSDTGGDTGGDGGGLSLSQTEDGSEDAPYLAGTGADTFAGSGGADWVDYAGSQEGVTIDLSTETATVGGGAADDTLTGINNLIGSNQGDNLRGNSAPNTLRGGGGADTLDGGEGDDVLEGGVGADTLAGGEGDDKVLYGDAGVGVKVDLSNTGTQADFDGAAANNNEAVGDTLSDIEDVVGSSHDDWLTGDDEDNDLQGGEGDDRLEGGVGADTLAGGAGDDKVLYDDAGEGVKVDLSNTGTQADFDGTHGFTANQGGEAVGDTLSDIEDVVGSNHDDWLTGDDEDNDLQGGEGNDRLEGGAGDDVLEGGVGADTLAGGAGDDRATYDDAREGVKVDLSNTGTQQDFDDTYIFNANNNEAVGDTISDIEDVVGSDHNDWLTGDGEDNDLQGGAGRDRLEGGVGADTLAGGDDRDNLYGGEDNDNLYGDKGNDFLYGDEGNDDLYGGEGNDDLYGGEGNDDLYGGEGLDTYEFESGGGTDTVTDDGGNIAFAQGTGNDYAGATYSFTRTDEGRSETVTLTVTDSSGNTLNVIEFSSDPSSYTFYTRNPSGSGEEIPASSLVVPPIQTVKGSKSNPFLATDDADTFTGEAGADWVSYAGSTNTVKVDLRTDPASVSRGWAVGDTLSGINNLIGSDDSDELIGNHNDNILRGGEGHDRLTGGGGADTLDGGDRGDTLNGGAGADTLDGGSTGIHPDTATYENSGKGVRVSLALTTAQEDFDGTNGFNANNNEAVGDTLTDIENLMGSDYNDWLTGDGNDNTLIGEDGDDRLEGGAGDDLLDGGAGADTLDGGDGIDTVFYHLLSYEGVRVNLALTTAQEDFDGTHGFIANNNKAVGDILTNIENIEGSKYDDWLTGDGKDNNLKGGKGNDRLEGGEGADTLDGGEGADTLDGGEGIDIVSYDGFSYEGVRVNLALTTAQEDFDGSHGFTANNNVAVGDILSNIEDISGSRYYADWLTGDGNDNKIYGHRGHDRLEGGAGNDILEGGAGNDNLYGGAGNDRLVGGTGDNTLDGGEGDDTLVGGTGYNTFIGGEGLDTYVFYYYYDVNSGTVTDDGGKIVFRQENNNGYVGATYTFTRADGGRSEEVTLTVRDSRDYTLNVIEFSSDPSSYTFYTSDNNGVETEIPASSLVFPLGSESNPFLATGAADAFTGEAGADWVSYRYSTDAVDIDLSNDPATVSGGAARDTLSGINNVIGSIFDDTLTGDGDPNTLRGGRGVDKLRGGGGTDTLEGGTGQDDYIFDATSGSDTISRDSDGGRILFPEASLSDIATFVLDRDPNNYGMTLSVGSTKITIAYDDYTDQQGIYSLHFGAGNTLLGNIYVGLDEFDDILLGSSTSDIIVGLSGDDDLYGNDGNDILEGGDGKDELYGGSDSDVLSGGNGIDWLSGDRGDDDLYGGEDGDVLLGGRGNDRLYGGSGNDRMIGESGNDELYGGDGEDTYEFDADEGTDTVNDDGGNILFRQGLNDDYEGATYSFSSVNGKDRLTVAKDGNTLNVIDFSSAPSLYTFYTGSVSPDDEIPANLLVVPLGVEGSESNPFLATNAADSFTGSAGADWVSYAGSTDGVSVDLRTDPADVYNGATGDTLTGINNIIGSDHGDFLIGNSGDNILRGGAGKDYLTGGAGADILDGGAGEDAAYYYFSGKGVRVNLLLQGGGQAQQDFEANSYGFTANQNEAVGDILSNIESILGSGHDDWLTGDGNDNSLQGGGGNDRLEGGTGNDYLDGGLGNDEIYGGAGVDTYKFNAYNGTDTIVDDGGKIVFSRSIEHDYNRYEGATYTFTRADGGRSEEVTLTVKDSRDNTLNVIEFSSDPSSYTFYTRDNNGVETEIPASSLVVPARLGTESNPFLATDAADTFTGSAGADWVSYAESTDTRGVTVDLRVNPANVDSGAAGDTLRGINNLVGSDHNDRLFGNRDANIMRGGDGNDDLIGFAGADTLDGGAGVDTAYYGSSAKGVRVSLALTTAQIDFDGTHGFTANQGGDAVGDILSNIEDISGSRYYADWLTGDGSNNRLYGRGGNDRLEGGAGNDILEGGAGADTLIGGAGTDTYIFWSNDGTDKDTIIDDGGKIVFLFYTGATYTFVRADAGRGEAATLTVKDSNDNTLNVIEFTSDPSSYTFYTRDGGVDTIISTSLLVVPPRLIPGGEGSPYLATDAADTFTGSDGADWVSYAGSTGGVDIDLSTDPATVSNTVSNAWADGDTLSGINNLIGSDHSDTLTGNDGANSLRGGDRGDTLNGGAGADNLDGGEGSDSASYENSAKRVRVDLSHTGAQQDFDGTHGFTANENEAVGDILTNIEIIIGSNYDDWLTGDGSNNRLYGKGGNDRLEGGGGRDWLYGGAGADIIDGGSGTDFAWYSGSSQGVRVSLFLQEQQQRDFETNTFGFATDQDSEAVGDILTNIQDVAGSDYNDWLTGDHSSNTLWGRDGDDRLEGAGGSDSLYGGAGDDTLIGGDGRDSYRFHDNEGGGKDTIIDDGGNIHFFYTGATYSFVRADGGRGEEITLTVSKDGNTLNVIEFTSDPSRFAFYTRSGGVDTRIPTNLLVIPARVGSEQRPFEATAEADTFTGTADEDWVSYANSNRGVDIDLSSDPATVSNAWADGDTLRLIENLIGSNYGDILTGDGGVNKLRGGGGTDFLEGGAGKDDYIFDATSGSSDTIRSDPDGGRLLFRSANAQTQVHLERDANNDVVVVAGDKRITIVDRSPNDAYQHGSYSIHYGAQDNFAYNVYAGRNNAVDTLIGSNNIDFLSAFGESDSLYGNGGADILVGGDGNDYLDGGSGGDTLIGGRGSDTYFFESGDGDDYISDPDVTTNNKLIFRSPQFAPYENNDFFFIRGTYEAGSGFAFSLSGSDLRIRVDTGSLFDPNIRNVVIVEDYFYEGADAYTIYYSNYNSFGGNQWLNWEVVGQPAES